MNPVDNITARAKGSWQLTDDSALHVWAENNTRAAAKRERDLRASRAAKRARFGQLFPSEQCAVRVSGARERCYAHVCHGLLYCWLCFFEVFDLIIVILILLVLLVIIYFFK